MMQSTTVAVQRVLLPVPFFLALASAKQIVVILGAQHARLTASAWLECSRGDELLHLLLFLLDALLLVLLHLRTQGGDATR